jgi:hypothetical protein
MKPKRKLTRRVSRKSAKKKRVRLSGWEYEKRRRERRAAAAEAAGVSPVAELIPSIGPLQSASDWLEQIGEIFRRARAGLIEKSDASKLAWIASEAAKLSRSIEELSELQQLRQQLAQLNGGQLPHHIARTEFVGEDADA